MTAALGGLGIAGWMFRAGRAVPDAMGSRDLGSRAPRLQASPEWSNGTFHNQHESAPAELELRTLPGTLRELMTDRESRRPARDVPLSSHPVAPASTGTHLTWCGHSSAVVQLDGTVILLDPVWSDRCSPSQQVGPRRLHPVPFALSDLPPVDAVVISHDHYDHLDMDSIKEVAATWPQTRFVVPLGVGAHLETWGVTADRIDELDWHDEVSVAGIRLIATPAQHFSGRGLSRNGTLWASWALIGPESKVFYSGDTGYFPEFADIGAAYGPFDLSLIQVGAYDNSWLGVHMTPEQGIQTHLDVRADTMIPVHWGTFNLAFHPWAEPMERLQAEAERRGVTVVVPKPGQTVDIAHLPEDQADWWREIV